MIECGLFYAHFVSKQPTHSNIDLADALERTFAKPALSALDCSGVLCGRLGGGGVVGGDR